MRLSIFIRTTGSLRSKSLVLLKLGLDGLIRSGTAKTRVGFISWSPAMVIWSFGSIRNVFPYEATGACSILFLASIASNSWARLTGFCHSMASSSFISSSIVSAPRGFSWKPSIFSYSASGAKVGRKGSGSSVYSKSIALCFYLSFSRMTTYSALWLRSRISASLLSAFLRSRSLTRLNSYVFN